MVTILSYAVQQAKLLIKAKPEVVKACVLEHERFVRDAADQQTHTTKATVVYVGQP